MTKRTEHQHHSSGPEDRIKTLQCIQEADAFVCFTWEKDDDAPHGFRVRSMRHGTSKQRADALMSGVIFAEKNEPEAFEAVRRYFASRS